MMAGAWPLRTATGLIRAMVDWGVVEVKGPSASVDGRVWRVTGLVGKVRRVDGQIRRSGMCVLVWARVALRQQSLVPPSFRPAVAGSVKPSSPGRQTV